MNTNNLKKVWVFFYGTFMSADILQQSGINCSITHPAKIMGFQLVIQPRVNLIELKDGIVYGAVALVDQVELTALYQKVEKQFSHTYFPYPVSARLFNDSRKLALCFISEPFDNGMANPEYIAQMIQAAKQVGAPASYLDHIESFKQ